MDDIRKQIKEIVDRETRAWNTQDVTLLLTVFHHDMVWPWPRTPQSHDPIDWVIEWGRYNYERWRSGWQELFDAPPNAFALRAQADRMSVLQVGSPRLRINFDFSCSSPPLNTCAL